MRVLLVVHGWPPAPSGGTELYTRTLAHALAARGIEVHVVTREANPCRPEYTVRRCRDDAVHVAWINNTFAACTSFEDSYANPALLRRVEEELERVSPDVLHVQHLTCLSTGIPGAAARRGIPSVMTLNDYWLICHRGQLLTAEGARCEGPFEGGCERCVPAAACLGSNLARAGKLAASLALPRLDPLLRRGLQLLDSRAPADRRRAASLARLQHMREAVRPVDHFLAPSGTLEHMFLRFGLAPDRLQRCAQGIPIGSAPASDRARSGPLRVGFAGALIPSKAPHVLLEAAALLPAGSIEVHLFGEPLPFHGDRSYPERLRELPGWRAVRRSGVVPHAEMPAALGRMDVLVVPSIWVENAPFVIREAFAAGTPVLASDLGGMAEMVGDGLDGLLFPPGDAAALARRLARLIEEPELIGRLRGGISRPMSIAEDAEQLEDLYRRLAGPRRPQRAPTPSLRNGRPASDPAAVVLNYRTPDQTFVAVRSLQTSRQPPGLVLVVDNGSGDDSASVLRARLANVDVIEAATNLGFPGGCNRGIARALAAGSPFVLLVNSDVVLHPDTLGQLCDAAARRPDVGILAPLVVSREEPERIASAGIRYKPSTGRMVHVASGRQLSERPAAGVVDVDAVGGCVMLIRGEVLRAIGGLDEEYFFSFEDIDFCLRARAAGFRVVCVDDALAYHVGGLSIGTRSARRVYFAARNHLRLAARCTPSVLPMAAARAGLIVGLNLAYAVTSPDVPLLPGIAAVARGTWHHLVGRYGDG